MYKFLKNLSCLLCLLAVFGSCRKKAFDEYYGRPANLAPPIYQVLDSRGNFTTLLKLVDLAGYKDILGSAGYWTFFAPNDAAFQKYFAANNTSLAAINQATARKIVTYCLVINAFGTDHIADYQSPAGWVPSLAFKRRTSYYDGFSTGSGPEGDSTLLVTENRNGGGYLFGDNNNKYIPYFFSTFMAQEHLTATDYNYFFPTGTYTGFNVANASVVNKDIVAENGVIHEIDQVIMPLPNIEQKLASGSQYSLFKSILEKYLVTYTKDANYTRQYSTINNGKVKNAYVKIYDPLLTFAPGNENFQKLEDNDGQKDGYTLFAPTNDVLQPYLTNVILKYYGTLDKLPINIIEDLVNVHMFPTMVWPSKFASTTNNAGEPARFDATTNVVDKQFCSNGLFYGVNKVQQGNVFSTVYARAYLDPNYSIMTKLITAASAKILLSSPGLRFTVFMMPDATLRAMGYDYDQANSYFTQTTNGVLTTGLTPLANLTRLLNMCIVSTPNNELNNLSGDGITETNGGEYLRWHNNTVFNAGLTEQKTALTVTGFDDYSNGRVYYLGGNSLFPFPTLTIFNDIAANGTNPTDPYYDFYQYLLNSSVVSGTTPKEIIGISLGAPYTVLVPTQAAMKQAVIDGYLPGTTTGTGAATQFVSFNYKPTSTADISKVATFILYHILTSTIVPDGKKGPNGNPFPTMVKNDRGDAYTVSVFNQPGNLKFSDAFGRMANVTAPNNSSFFPATSNYLGTYCVLHQIDNYLRYNLQ
ncbi:uncharacterized protein DUF4993 [Mucilaginibacter yixingensis]|uniref:Uncharacterized protein DUF4993 n=1 Tax=Mucilaginibacter yixingensis TaxID=1295612 RepID=A0A2T5JB94_9SPHI|nr:fasciclin domain-containing protein [Mucilaginibacter yixingensis]PTQ98137.1 uncharacterized protein DUF4993 [Mucilaginibacter yixingensis]